MLQLIFFIISFSVFLDYFHLVSLVFYIFPKIYFSSPFPSILLIFVTLFIFLLYPTNLYISCIFYQFFGFLDPIPLHFIFLESQDYHLFITTTKYFWNPLFGILGCSFWILRTYSFTI
jgi:hypothetical protein